MEAGNKEERRFREDHVVAVAVDHVRLCFHYLDVGDVEGYGSLFEEQAVLYRPGRLPVRGRVEVERLAADRREAGKHVLFAVFGAGRRVAALGRLVPPIAVGADPDTGIDFADLFVVSDKALIVERRSFYFVPPG